MTDTACAQLKARNATLVAQIAANETDAAAWINLGALRKINNDYRGAEAAWIYVTKLYPSNSTAYANLGDLYMNFLHDYTRAETNYLLATKYAPTDASLYQTLFTLYTSTSYKPSATAAEDILKKGIAANPRAIDLEVVLARYYKSLGRIADAKVQYDAAIANAKSQGQTALAAQIHEEEGQ
jgi:tetratricopeptide (TPR) repeat protein